MTPITVNSACARHFSQHVFKGQPCLAHKTEGARDLAGRCPPWLVLQKTQDIRFARQNAFGQ
jgi:hypothetical protein